MATAANDYETVRKTVTEKVVVTRLTLSSEEAQALRAVLGHVGGAREDGRKHIDAITNALSATGHGRGPFSVVPKSGGVFFEPQPQKTTNPFTFDPYKPVRDTSLTNASNW